jgi:hypothetical protein
MLMEVIATVVRGLDQLAELVPTVEELGRRHTGLSSLHGGRSRSASASGYSRSPMEAHTAPKPFEAWTNDCGEEGFLHGTKADLTPGDLIEPGRSSNYGSRDTAAFVYLTATLDAATWGAELAVGDGRGRIYVVEPTGPFEDDPNLTDKKFPGNPTRSYRTRAPLRVTGEITDWKGHPPEQLQAMRDGLARLTTQGVEAINE